MRSNHQSPNIIVSWDIRLIISWIITPALPDVVVTRKWTNLWWFDLMWRLGRYWKIDFIRFSEQNQHINLFFRNLYMTVLKRTQAFTKMGLQNFRHIHQPFQAFTSKKGSPYYLVYCLMVCIWTKKLHCGIGLTAWTLKSNPSSSCLLLDLCRPVERQRPRLGELYELHRNIKSVRWLHGYEPSRQ